jgi:preprotein translocase subunit SecD
MNKKARVRPFFWLLLLILGAAYIAFPDRIAIDSNFLSKQIKFEINKPAIDFYFWGKHVYKNFSLKKGLDIQGGMQVVLRAKMDNIALEDRETALESARDIIGRRVDLYGISEPSIQAARLEDDYRLIVELPGVEDPQQALDLVGRTAELEFRLERQLSEEELSIATQSANFLDLYFTTTALTGQQLKKAQLQFDQQTAKPQITLEFDDEGRDLFADITKNNIDKILAIFIDGYPVVTPTISNAILDGQAVMTGDFTVEEAKNLAIQLNAGALPVNIEVLEQKNIGASLGDESVQKSINAGLVGLALVILFMILYYGWLGVISSLALLIYAILTIALYKIIGVVLTLPGIAGLILTIGMAVDANILIFERIKEEQRAGRSFAESMELGFGRAWNTVKDANLASIVTALVLINPLNFSFLNTSGLVKGFGITFLLGSLLSMFTGVTVSRMLVRQLMPLVKAKEFKS